MQTSLAQILSQSRLMAGLPNDLMESLARHFEKVHDVPAGEVFKKNGEDAQAAFLVRSGNVQVAESRGLAEEAYAYTVGRGEMVGVPALLEGAAVDAEFRAAENTTLAALPRAAFDEWLATHPQYREPLSENAALDRQFHLLRKTQLFSELNAIDLYVLVRELAPCFEQHQAGDHLFRENGLAEAAFLVGSGEYRIVKESAKDTVVATLSAGALTGLAGLFQYGKYNAALRVVSHGECWRLPRAQIEQLRSRSRRIDERVNRELALPRLKNDALLFQPETEEGARLILELLRENPASLWQRYGYNHQEPWQVLGILEQATGIDPLYPTDDLLIDTDLPRRFPEAFARLHKLMPVFYDAQGVQVLTITPFLGSLVSECARLLNAPVRLRLTEPKFLERLIENTYQNLGEIEDDTVEDASEDDWQQLEKLDDVQEQAQAAPVIKLVNSIFSEAINRGVSDIHLDPGETRLNVRYRIDGILQVVNSVPHQYQPAVISRIKILADLDIAERRLPQDGRISLRVEGRSYDLRVATVPTVHGESVVMRILDKSSIRVSLEDLQMGPTIGPQWGELIHRANGIVLVTGPTGSGKTTTLYSTINEISSPEVNIITVEDPVEYQLEGIKQIQVNAKINLTFASVLRSILRLDPDIILVGEIRDAETAETAAQAALTGHLVFSTLHTNDTATAVTRLIDMGVDPYLVASTVIGIFAQRLVRRSCSDCRTQDGDGTWHAPGCRHCDYSGFRGRLGIYELLLVTDELRQLIMEGRSSAEIQQHARDHGMATLLEDGQAKVEQGLSTRDEVFRVGH
jgi:general secretion pathway protein E